MNTGAGFASLIATLAIMGIIFVVCRAIVLWYWRVNEGITLLKSTDEKLGQLVSRGIDAQAVPARVVPAARANGTR